MDLLDYLLILVHRLGKNEYFLRGINFLFFLTWSFELGVSKVWSCCATANV